MNDNKELLVRESPTVRPDWEANDCTVLALSNAKGIPYEEAHAILKAHGRKDRNGPMIADWSRAVRSAGLQMEPAFSSITLGRFLREHPGGRWVLHVSGHAFAVVDGKVVDHLGYDHKPGKHIKMAYRVV